jgi:hypothetical protein
MKINKRMNKKAASILSLPWVLIFGFIAVVALIWAISSGISHALHTYTQSEKSLNTLLTAMEDMSKSSVGAGSIRLVPLKLDDDSALYFINNNSDLIEKVVYGSEGAHQESSQLSVGDWRKWIIQRPAQCVSTQVCVCLCKGQSKEEIKDTSNWELLLKRNNIPITSNSAEFYRTYQITCAKGLDCVGSEKIKLQDVMQLQYMTDAEYYKTFTDQKEFSYVSEWTHGFSFAREDNDEVFKNLARSLYVDLYVVKHADGTVGLCLDSKCLMRV